MKMKDFTIVFSGLKLGKHHFDYELDQAFFDLFEYQELNSPQFKVELSLEKKSTMLELEMKLAGEFDAICDISNESFPLGITNEMSLVVKFGEHFNDEDDEVLVLPFEAYELNIAQYLYEMAVLAIPVKIVHPDVESGKLGQEYKKYLKGEDETNNEEQTDPRWDKLKDLLNK